MFSHDGEILVVGDSMLDKYRFLSDARQAQERPVPIYHQTSQFSVPGGAANVAMQLGQFGQRVTLLTVGGRCLASHYIRKELGKVGVEVKFVKRSGRLPIKERVFNHDGRMLHREDHYDNELVKEKSIDVVDYQMCRKGRSKPRAIVFSDYGKGAIDSETILSFMSNLYAANLFSVVDPAMHGKTQYLGVQAIKLNRHEVEKYSGLEWLSQFDIDEVKTKSSTVALNLGINEVIITHGKNGASLYRHSERELIYSNGDERPDLFTVGAGDAFLSAYISRLHFNSKAKNLLDFANAHALHTCESLQKRIESSSTVKLNFP